MQLREDMGQLQMVRKNVRILQNSAKFSAGRPPLPAYNSSATIASASSTYRLVTENVPRQLRYVDWAGNYEWQSYRIIATRL